MRNLIAQALYVSTKRSTIYKFEHHLIKNSASGMWHGCLHFLSSSVLIYTSFFLSKLKLKFANLQNNSKKCYFNVGVCNLKIRILT